MKKFQVIISFEITEEFMQLVPPHRTYIGYLINKCIVDCYLVSMESQTVWITFSTKTKDEVEKYLRKSPLYPFWAYTIEELFVYDGQLYRLPSVQLN
jgi:hypothetical protein